MVKLKFLVSACLAGIKCRYDGRDSQDKKIIQLVNQGKALPFCPEQLCGLPTPRIPSQIVYNSGKGKVISCKGEDLSQFFFRGADLSSRLAQRFKISSAYLKSKSPSCGYGLKKRKDKTVGITSAHFLERGMRIFLR